MSTPGTDSWLDQPLKRNVDAKTQADLAKLELVTVRDLLRHFPRRYLHPSATT
jgi:RecG-like helicase